MSVGRIVMDDPVESSLLDQAKDALVGRAINRIDGPVKVSGRARYAADHDMPGLVHAVLVQAPFGAGRVTHVDSALAAAMPGVIAIIDDSQLIRNGGDFAGSNAPVQGAEEVAFFGQPVAVVVADTFERARAAARTIRIEFQSSEGAFDFLQRLDTAQALVDDLGGFFAIHTERGDVESALDRAAARLECVWTTPSQSHAAMEPHASVAVWDGDHLTIHGSYQSPATTRGQLASSLGIDPANVRVVSRFVGGGFGSKLGVMPEAVAAAIASRAVGRPVKIAMTRQQAFETTGRRAETWQRIRLGSERDGRLTAVSHEVITSQLDREIFFEPAAIATRFLYSGEHRLIDHKVVRLNKVLSVSMRAPGEAVGQIALECAMDELAEKLGIDPVELRIKNEPSQHPETGASHSSRSLRECLIVGAERFGWRARNIRPGTMRRGDYLIGHGMAVAARGNLLGPSKARVRIEGNGRVTIETEMTDIGTGTYTVLAQIAADLLGVPMECVNVKLGDTDDPASAGSGGSWGAATSGSAVYAACQALREKLAAAAGCRMEEMSFAGGYFESRRSRRSISEVVGEGMQAEGSVEPGKVTGRYSQASYGAHFCEIGVNIITGETRVLRWNSVFAAGRIINLKTAASQCMGGVIFGIGAALIEELVHDTRSGKIVNRDLAEYHIPTHADIPEIDVHFLDERDRIANPLHSKGLGELGISGAGAAVVNAIYNATGVRVRDLPVTLDKILPHLP